MTLGLEVLVHEVIDAMTTDPFVTFPGRAPTVTGTGALALLSDR